jgi:hypothetical protein
MNDVTKMGNFVGYVPAKAPKSRFPGMIDTPVPNPKLRANTQKLPNPYKGVRPSPLKPKEI